MVAPVVTRIRHSLALRFQCRKEWVEGHGTLAEIARKHSVPHSTVIAWYRRDGWGAARKRWLEKQFSDNDAPTAPQICDPNPKITTNTYAEMLAELGLQLAAIDNQIENANSPLELQRLASARRNLFEQWCVLARIPKRPAKGHPQPMAPVAPISPRAPVSPSRVAPIGDEGKPALNQAA